jgi:predicted sugar kinase
VRPEAGKGISGTTEQAYFGQQNFMPADLVSELISILSGQIDAALLNGDFDQFAAQLERYGNLAGSFYAQEQGDIFSDPVIRKLVDHLHKCGTIGAAQSSWGPGICIPARSESHAREILTQVPDQIAGSRLVTSVTEAMNHGATHAWPAPERREGHAFA